LSAVEEYYRARLLNAYNIEKEIIDPINSSIKNNELIELKGEISNLYKFSFSRYFTFDRLMSLLKSTKMVSCKVLKDLEKLRVFRNKVMHHKLIVISYHEARRDIENEIEYVEEMCEIIYRYLPNTMREAFQGNINACNHLTSRNRVPNLEMLCLREMKDGLFR
jgi:hypothetical protein